MYTIIVLFTIALTAYVTAWPWIAGSMQNKRTLAENKRLKTTVAEAHEVNRKQGTVLAVAQREAEGLKVIVNQLNARLEQVSE